MAEPYDIAIAGAGFSGLMVVANLIRRNPARPRIFWADPKAEWGFGLAYSTFEPCHLLNVRADRMGAFADGIDDFWRWLQNNYPGEYRQDDFVPRMLYGQYLQSIRDRFPNVKVQDATIRHARREDGLWVLNAGKDRVRARKLVIATGNPPIASLGWPDNDIYIDDFWHWRMEGGAAGRLPDDSVVVIAGTGLTAADAVLGLLSDGYKGRILCVSTHGKWPETHERGAPYEGAAALAAEMKADPSVRRYLHAVRLHAKKAPWRDVIDGLRPYTVDLWQVLPEPEKARFMRHLWSRWNVRRHRMAPSIAARMAESGRVQTLAGRIDDASDEGRVRIRLRGAGEYKEVQAAKVLNCTGPSYRRMIRENPLLASLLEHNYIAPGPLGLGVAVQSSGNLFAVGTPLLGERFETTSVPDLRLQAADLAGRLG